MCSKPLPESFQHLNGVFRYAQAKGFCRDNPAGPAREILPRKKDNGRMPALLEWAALGDLLRRAEMARLAVGAHGASLVRLTAARIGNVVDAEWRNSNSTTISRSGHSARQDESHGARHRPPLLLCPQIVEELRQWREMFGGRGFAFLSPAGGTHRPGIHREGLSRHAGPGQQAFAARVAQCAIDPGTG
ncbi:MAG: hypothetical protein IPN40_16295 [Uliginosibacterium sp.]|nr:hypothetical protein [Uliginosibacterium sp.]